MVCFKLFNTFWYDRVNLWCCEKSLFNNIQWSLVNLDTLVPSKIWPQALNFFFGDPLRSEQKATLELHASVCTGLNCHTRTCDSSFFAVFQRLKFLYGIVTRVNHAQVQCTCMTFYTWKYLITFNKFSINGIKLQSALLECLTYTLSLTHGGVHLTCVHFN